MKKGTVFSILSLKAIFQNPLLIGFAVVILLVSTAILSGCSVKAIPSAVPVVTKHADLSLSGVSVEIINDEKNDNDQELSGKITFFIVNRKQWTEYLISSLSQELQKRGGVITATSPLKIQLAMPEISAEEGQNLWRFHVKTTTNASSGWSKSYRGTAAASLWSTGGFGGSNYIAGRAASATVAEIVKAMLSDAEFIEQLKSSINRVSKEK